MTVPEVSGGPRIGVYGDHALMVDLAGLDDVHALAAALRAAQVPGVVDVVPAARTVLVLLDDTATAADLARVEDAVRAVWESRSAVVQEGEGRLVEIPVVYDGQDLPDVAAWAGLSVAEVVARHGGREYVVAFGGFMPGFGYLTEVDPTIAAPRLATPRTRVPAGSVALAGDLTAVYPRATPGGWRLLGRTDVELFDVDRDPPALLTAGTRVRFREVDRLPGDAEGDVLPAEGDGHSAEGDQKAVEGDAIPVDGDGRPAEGDGAVGEGDVNPAEGDGHSAEGDQKAVDGDAIPVDGDGRPVEGDRVGGVEVLATGPLTLVEDEGRPGWASSGVGRSGAADQRALRLLNRLLANDDSAAALEVTLGGLVLRFHERATIALAGATAPAVLDGTSVGMQAVLEVRPGAELHLGYAARGTRTYLGVRGGFDVTPVLGSRSFDVLAGLGPAPLRAGDRLAIGPRPSRLPVVDLVAPRPATTGIVELAVRRGVRDEWFDDDAWRGLLGATFEVTDASNRVGLRLSGAPIGRRSGELPSEGLVPGAIQVPPDGQPVLFLRDHPVTGGYPVIGVVRDGALDVAAQLRPGDRLRFWETS
ncbi:5-oxoprolinase subunit PxpB [Oerskovia sp. KBS0722]|uniref:5-oxoprolinase subunit PxpB n=1 Tax=Oerskovia sp. KBS0722 TaxID=1179673 RepID=UPI00110E479B|nr:5-oxoprolinase subunit PxpB [Oerskovia sp. KBS0722]QDW64018.1 5-oxoprolinase subunit PxpB [Oerskovia sp. KBS0722]